MWAANLTAVAQTLCKNKQIHPVILEKTCPFRRLNPLYVSNIFPGIFMRYMQIRLKGKHLLCKFECYRPVF